MPDVIWVPLKNCQGPVYLLGNDDPGQTMRQGPTPYRKNEIRSLPRARIPSVRPPDTYEQVLVALIPDVAQTFCELQRALYLSIYIHQHDPGGRSS